MSMTIIDGLEIIHIDHEEALSVKKRGRVSYASRYPCRQKIAENAPAIDSTG